MNGSVGLCQPAIFRLVPDCPRPDKLLLRTRRCRGHSEQCPTPDRTFLARPGIAEAPSKSVRPSPATECCVDRAQEFAPSRQRFYPTVLVVVRLGREHQGLRCCPAKARGRGRTSLWQARNPAAPSIDNKPVRAGFRASSVGVFAWCLRPAPLRHGERWSNLDHRNTRERSHERVWPTPAQKRGRAAQPARKSPPPSLNRLERLSCALQEPSPGGTRRKLLNCLSA